MAGEKARSVEEWVAYARQEALFGGPHPLLAVVAGLPVAEQDAIDRFLMAAGRMPRQRGGSLIEELHEQAVVEACESGLRRQPFTVLLARQLSRMAAEWAGRTGGEE